MKKRPITAYKGTRIAVEGHSWLHQVLPSISYELFHKKECVKHVELFMRKVESLLMHGITPVIVFDGDPLQSKELTNSERTKLREKYANEVEFYLKHNEPSKARELMKRCASVTPSVLWSVIHALQTEGIEYIISPYESDAQLAFLQKSGYINYIISEDSDLIPYGCSRVLYKYSGTTVEEYDAARLRFCKDIFFSENVLEICILSGCDYLKSIRGIGINTAYKRLSEHKNVRSTVEAIRAANKNVSSEYISQFAMAKLTFLHHIVYNPMDARRVHLNAAPCEYEFLGTLENVPYFITNSGGKTIEVQRHYVPGASQELAEPTSDEPSILDDLPSYILASETSPYFD